MTLVDCAGARIGGAKRLLDEFDAYLADRPGTRPEIVGRGRELSARWLARREVRRPGVDLAVSLNNVSWTVVGSRRTVLVHGPQHFLTERESAELRPYIPFWIHLEAQVVQYAMRRADVVVVPATSMAERVAHAVPAVADRITVLHNPVSDLLPAPDLDVPKLPPTSFLCPIVDSPHKQMARRLRVFAAAADLLARPPHLLDVTVVMTTPADAMPADVREHPRLRLIGRQPTAVARELMRRSSGIVFPTELESFGYPLAEARIMRVPVVGPDTAHNREIAGPALSSYATEDPEAVAGALHAALRADVPAAPAGLFDREAYFDRLLGRT